MIDLIKKEAIYLWYYIDIQFRQIFIYWLVGMILGSFISVFAKDKIHNAILNTKDKSWGLLGIIPATLLGVISPLCMYGTIPLAAALKKSGVREDYIASFCMSSILLNPQLIIYSVALGKTLLLIRIISCIICGILAGVLVFIFFKKLGKEFFDFSKFDEASINRDTDNNLFIRYLKNLLRNIKATGPYFLLGIILSAIFQRYIPEELIVKIFGNNKFFGVLMAATIGVPLYVCGGGTIPIILDFLSRGMSVGAATAFMITGPSTKITNLGALKICLPMKRFAVYLIYVMLFSLACGIFINVTVLLS